MNREATHRNSAAIDIEGLERENPALAGWPDRPDRFATSVVTRMQKLNSRQKITKEFAAIMRIMGHPDRIRILEELSCEEKDVKSLLQSLDLPGPRVSQHLSLLRAHRIVDERRAGRHHVYRIVQPALVQWITRGLDAMELQSAKIANSSLGKIT